MKAEQPAERAPVGLPVGGRRGPSHPPAPHLSRAIELALARPGEVGSISVPHLVGRADPAAEVAVRAIVADHAQLPPVCSELPGVANALGRATTIGWAIGRALLGQELRYSGGDEGSASDIAPCLLSRASLYAFDDIVVPFMEAGFGTWTREVAMDPSALAALAEAGVNELEQQIGLLRGAALGGLAVACAEYEIYAPELDVDLVMFLEADLPHHHRYNHFLGLTQVTVAGEQRLGLPCQHEGCRRIELLSA